jgi:hypothetical protein
MLKPAAAAAQTGLEMVALDQRVPRDHLLRLIDAHIRFEFIREKTEGLYCQGLRTRMTFGQELKICTKFKQV